MIKNSWLKAMRSNYGKKTVRPYIEPSSTQDGAGIHMCDMVMIGGEHEWMNS